ncbi:MAG: SDR family NAD(P)-dependent oxidoreductase [Vampirovibrionales bacterium]|nr:SDR family NAD(P)-dependent oxidoreductase [Vampirovibrionales bacterium]
MTAPHAPLNSQTVLVTGAGGFIGSHLVEALVAQGAQVRAMVRYNGRNDWGSLERLPRETLAAISVMPGDITDPFFVRRAVSGCQTVFHLAALIGIPYSYMAPQHYVAVNVQGALNVLEACREACQTGAPVKLIQTSTSETYGTALYTPIDEAHPLQGQSPYSATKIAADKLVESYVRSFDLPATILRPFNTFGPRQSARAIIPTIIAQALADEGPIRVGSLDPVRDFLFVEDTVRGFLAAALCERNIGEVVHIGTGQARSIGETLTLILKRLNCPDRPVQTEAARVRPANSEVEVLLCNPAKAKALMGWTPQTSFEDGLQRVIDAMAADRPRDKAHLYTV